MVLISIRLAGVLLSALVVQPAVGPSEPPRIEWFLEAASHDDRVADAALARLAGRWRDGYAALLVDLARLTRPRQDSVSVDVRDLVPGPDPQGLTAAPRYAGAQFASIDPQQHPTTRVRARLLRFLRQQTSQRFGDDLDRWRVWTWSLPYDPHPDYLSFKAEAYAGADPVMAAFFVPGTAVSVRLDEIEWTGISPLEVPALVAPVTLPAPEGRHVRDSHLVLGVWIHGEARAYPARLIAPHQLVADRLGERDLLVAYCPFSGVAAAYDTTTMAVAARFGTSGLVYRSHTLMFDRATRSLWSVLTGERVAGPADEERVALVPVPVEVTTWREWRLRHPDTTVLSSDTGHAFTYVESAFTRQRLRRIGLQFPVPYSSPALSGDRDIVGIRPAPGADRPMAIALQPSARRELRSFDSGGRRLVAVTSGRRALQAFDAADVRFVALDAEGRVVDAEGHLWRIEPDALVREDDSSRRMARVATVHSSWAAWYARFPDTALIR